jgi:3-isopropylmalate dehydrogenase
MAKAYRILILAGDGIGPEVTEQAVRVLEHVLTPQGIQLEMETALVGGACLEAHDQPLLEETLDKARSVDGVLLGAVGGPQWDNLPHEKRPEQALLKLRSGLELFANLRPVKVFRPLAGSSTLRPEIIEGVDLLVVRELTGGIYFGFPRGSEGKVGERCAYNTLVYSEEEIIRLARRGFEIARLRRKKLHSVDKANILESSILWREVVNELSADYPDVQVEHMYVDNCAMQLVRNPLQFDVIVTNNMFGDILSDEAAMLTGSIGMLPSASVGALSNTLGYPLGMYEPVHGSAPDIVGKGLANPLATIMSVAMMLRYSFHNQEAAEVIEAAVERVLDQGHRTADLANEGEKVISTAEMGERVIGAVKG